jgi:hypothetical protein
MSVCSGLTSSDPQLTLTLMKYALIYPLAFVVINAIVVSCGPATDPPVSSHVTTAEEQANLTPDEVLRQFSIQKPSY